MKRLYGKEMDELWVQYISNIDFSNERDRKRVAKELIPKIKKIDHMLSIELIKHHKKHSKEHIKLLKKVALKRIKICSFIIKETKNSNEADGFQFDNLMKEMKNAEKELLLFMQGG